MTVNGVVRRWGIALPLLAALCATCSTAFAEDERRGQMVGVYPTVPGEDCLGIFWQFMVDPPDRTRVYTQFGELDQSWHELYGTSWDATTMRAVYKDGQQQAFPLRMSGDNLTVVGFRCGSDGLARVNVTDCDSGASIGDVLISDTETSRSWFRGHPTEADGEAIVSCNCQPPSTLSVKVEKAGYTTEHVEWTFSGRGIDDQAVCLQRDEKPPKVVGYVGCFAEQGDVDPGGLTNRDLDGFMFTNDRMTTEICVTVCGEQGFDYAGTQYSSYCFCGNSYGASGEATNCTSPCAGNPSQICGGSYANSVHGVP
jgi:hypothetical protein